MSVLHTHQAPRSVTQLVGSSEGVESLQELDALVAAALPSLESLERSLEHSHARDDQATRLRSMVEGHVGVTVDEGVRLGSPPERPARSAPRAPVHAAHPAGGSKIVVVASGKGGVGKTTLSVNLAVAMAQRGVRVTLMDADFGTANADVLCGVTPSARLDHVFMPGAGGERWRDGGARSLKDIAIDAPGGFRLIPGSTGVARMADLSASERRAIVGALEELESDTDVLVIDAGAGVGRSVTSFMSAADLTLVIATPEPTSIADAYALIKCAAASQGERAMETGDSSNARVSLVLNQAMDAAEAARVHARISAVCDRFLGLSCPLLGWVAQDVRVPQAVRSREPLLVRWPTASASVQIRGLAGTLTQHLGIHITQSSESRRPAGARGLVRRLLGI